MIKCIIRDFFYGLCDAFQFIEMILLLFTNTKILKIFCKITLFNIIVYIIPGFLFYDVYLYFMIFLTLKILSMVSSVLHTLYHIDIANIINRLYLIINICELTIYHSFYCFNNLWQCERKLIKSRIIQYEKLWPYYMGYGFVAALIYCMTHKMIWVGVYNIYMSYLIMVPFIIQKYQPCENSYPKINMHIFVILTNNFFNIGKYVLVKIYTVISNDQ